MRRPARRGFLADRHNRAVLRDLRGFKLDLVGGASTGQPAASAAASAAFPYSDLSAAASSFCLNGQYLAAERNVDLGDGRTADVSRVMNLLGNKNRLLILCHLMMHKEMKVGDIVNALKLSQSALSQHLTKLREDGLVEFRRESQTLYYRIADPRVTKLIRALKKLYCEDIS
jgi:DNA-binding transcriptional ArsR family regulator